MKSFKVLSLVAALAVTVFISACSSTNNSDPVTPSTVTGILQTSDAAAIPDALVVAFDKNGTVVSSDSTDEVGKFELSGLNRNLKDLGFRVQHAAYGVKELSYENLTASGDRQVSIILSDHDSCCGIISVNATAGGGVLQGASINIHKDGHRIANRSTDHSGIAVFHHLCEGEYVVSVGKDGYLSSLDTLTIVGCDSVSASITLEAVTVDPHDSCCSSTALITVTDSTTQALIAGATVHVSKDGHQLQAVPTNHDGLASLNHLCAGTYQLQIGASGYGQKTQDLVITCGENEQITVQLKSAHASVDTCCSGTVTLHVFDLHASTDIEGATITITRGHDTVGTVTSGTNGMGGLQALCSNSHYTITISAHGYHSRTVDYSTHDCLEVSYEIGLTPQ